MKETDRRTLLKSSGALILGGFMAGCTNSDKGGSTEITSSSFTASSGKGGNQTDSVDVSYDTANSTVVVKGRTWGKNACMKPKLKDATYDSKTDTLVVRVETVKENEKKACAEVITNLDYTARFGFGGSLPENVAVYHKGKRVRGTDSRNGNTAGSVSMTDRSFRVTSKGSGVQKDTVDVSFGDSRITLDGTIWGSDGCKTAELGDVSYDAESGELRVDVVTTNLENSGDFCTQAIVEIDYRASFDFEGGLPEKVVVSHRGEKVLEASESSARRSSGNRSTNETA
ncbi:MAG: hypothetical protein SV760_09090 [Halobacteria archaeon]|nr:hypothetical protein [Halobacteria archaeon]